MDKEFNNHGRFMVGQIPWNKGKKSPQISKGRIGMEFTDEHKKKLSGAWSYEKHITLKRNRAISEGLKKSYMNGTRTAWNKNKKLSKDHKERISLSNKGKELTKETKQKISDSNTGKEKTMLTKIKISLTKTGEKKFNGFKTTLNQRIRESVKYKKWRRKIFVKDNYTCQWCGQKGGTLQVDHIKPFAFYPKLRFDINNGRVLCIDCHKQTDTYLSKARIFKKNNG